MYLAKTDLFLQISLFVPLIIAFSALYDTAFPQKLFGKNLKLQETLCTISRYDKNIPFVTQCVLDFWQNCLSIGPIFDA